LALLLFNFIHRFVTDRRAADVNALTSHANAKTHTQIGKK